MAKRDLKVVNDHGKREDDLSPVRLPDEPGVVRTEIDASGHAVTIDFDPRLISEEGVRHVAEKLAPLGHQQYCRTILRLDGRASGAAEQKIENKAQKVTAFAARGPRFLAG